MIVDKPCKVIDPFTGSGTTAIACHKLGLEFTGYELDEMYYHTMTAKMLLIMSNGAKIG